MQQHHLKTAPFLSTSPGLAPTHLPPLHCQDYIPRYTLMCVSVLLLLLLVVVAAARGESCRGSQPAGKENCSTLHTKLLLSLRKSSICHKFFLLKICLFFTFPETFCSCESIL